MKTRWIAACAAVLAFSGVTVSTPASAVVISWDLSSPFNTNVGTTHTFTSSGINLYAAGFTAAFAPIDLYTKHQGGLENGLGINSDPANGCGSPYTASGCNHEIYVNTLVRLDTTAAQAAGLDFFQFAMGSSTNGEGWTVYGSTLANTGLVTLIAYGSDQGTPHNLALYNYYYVTYNGSLVQSGQGNNVLLTSFAGSNCAFGTSCGPPTATPLPAALPLFATGLGALGLFGWRRKRNASAAIVA